MNNNYEKFKGDIRRRAYVYAVKVIRFLNSREERRVSTTVVTKQLVRSATSVGANIVEAQAGRTKRDFTNFLAYALKSANESKFWLGLLRDTSKVEKNHVPELLVKPTRLLAFLPPVY